MMNDLFWLVLGLAASALLLFLTHRARRVWEDASRRGFGLQRQIGWALLGAIAPSRYWWGARIEALAPQERVELLAYETAACGLNRADSLCCPLCTVEIPRAWTLTSDGSPTVAPGPVECLRCDFRLDSCRHCVHFLPGSPKVGILIACGGGDVTSGRCSHHKVSQPVEEACRPDVARQLKARGYEYVRAPRPIVDSLFPPDFCTAFRPDRRRLRASEVRWPDARRAALLRLLALSAETEPAEEPPCGEEQWLL